MKKRTIYRIKELSDAGSERHATLIFSQSLASAKRFASKNQFFQGTVMRVCAEGGETLSTKENGSWRDE